MATAPLFISSMVVLKESLRLTGTASDDSLALVDRAVEKVRIGFYDALGASRVSQLVAMVYSENPTTTNELLRAKANNAEVSWVRLFLLKELPSMFVDGSAQVNQNWNEEGLTRDASAFDTNDQIKALQLEIEQTLAQLVSGDSDRPKLTVSVINPETAPNKVGVSLYV